MKIAVIGGTGLLGSNLMKLYIEKKFDVKSFSRNNNKNLNFNYNNIIDFNDMTNELLIKFYDWKPDIVINTIALVNLQECEKNQSLAYFVNVKIAKDLAIISKKIKSYYIHISTDHFYNDKKKIHTEKNKIVLLNYYAETKYEAEKEILALYKNVLIVRTNIIGFRNTDRNSFFEWLLSSIKKKEIIKLYSNFYTSPISVRELGNILIQCYLKNLNGIYNIASCEVIDKYKFGLKMANKFGYNLENIIESKININKSNALSRALTLGLDVSKIEKALKIKMPSIDATIDVLYNEYNGDK